MHIALMLYGNCTGDVTSFDRSAWTQIQMLMFSRVPWKKATEVLARCCHRRGSSWGAGTDNSSSTSWDVSAGPPAPRAKGAEAGGAHSTWRTSPLGSRGDVVLSPPPQRAVPPGLHLSLRGMPNTLKNERVPVRPTSGSSAWPHAVCGQSRHMTWADQVTHHVTSASGTKQWHREY